MRLWFPILIPPLATLMQLAVNYALVPLACATQQHAPIHLVSAATLAVAIAGMVMAHGAWRESGPDALPDGAAEASRTHFLSLMGVLIAALMGLATIAQWSTAIFIPPCVR